jgi:hypothetical protein
MISKYAALKNSQGYKDEEDEEDKEKDLIWFSLPSLRSLRLCVRKILTQSRKDRKENL